jgi:hypothetical protein
MRVDNEPSHREGAATLTRGARDATRADTHFVVYFIVVY